MTQLFNTGEVADYLRIKPRKVYDLVQRGDIPFTRVGSKLLFPKDRIDQWLGGGGEPAPAAPGPAVPLQRPPVIAGSYDPWMEWCVAESGCGLALLGGGAAAGLDRFAAGEVVACLVHALTPERGTFSLDAVRDRMGDRDIVVVEWVQREQGLVVPPGNPRGITGIRRLEDRSLRVACRSAATGSYRLFRHLLAAAGLEFEGLTLSAPNLRSEMDTGLAILNGQADTGLAVRAVAHVLRLDFVPLHQERVDLVMHRRDYFEPPVQRLLRFARSPAAEAKARELQGYTLTNHGTIHYNGP